MKKYLFITAGFILVFNSIAAAQIGLDTTVIEPHPSVIKKGDTDQLFHNMQDDKADSWLLSGDGYVKKRIAKYDVWAKLKTTSKNASFYHKQNSEFAVDYENEALHTHLHDVKEIELATTSITPQNAGKYRYRVINADGEELIPWTKVSDFRSNKFTTYAYLGKFNCEGSKTIILTITEVGNERNQAVYVYYGHMNTSAFIDKISVKYLTGVVDQISSEWTSGFRILSIKYPLNIQLRIENTQHNERYHVYLKRKYKGKVDTTYVGNNWEKTGENNPTIFIDRSFIYKPGVYTIIIQYELSVAGYPSRIPIGEDTWAHFSIIPLTAIVRLRTVAIMAFSLLVIGGAAFLIYRRRQNLKLAREEKDKTIATLQLQSVRAQLNPHFIFNALAGIQNLMNKNETENANKYLARFARLTRHVLDEGQNELTSIAQEVDLLNDYLEMEQMRFGFRFSINVDENVDQQIEIPAMLLQPFVENAVKHGISALKNEGFIGVNISRSEKNILLKVNDNGGGFVSTQTPGMGIKLCEERVKLLNSIYKNSTILLHINSTPIGAIIGIELKNWL